MALTKTKVNDGFTPLGGPGFGVLQRMTLAPGTSDYTTNGYALSGLEAGLGSTGGPANNGLNGVLIEGCNTAALGYVPYYNQQTGKWQVFQSAPENVAAAPLQEVANAANLTGMVWYVIYEGVSE